MADQTPFGMTGVPGGNPSGSNMPAPSPASASSPAIGGGNNPFLPSFPGGTQTPPLSSTINSAPTGASTPGGGFDVAKLLGFGNGSKDPLHDITKALGKAGFSAGVAGELANFLKNGAGFNPAVAQALIDAMQPGVQRKEANILEQFGSKGLRDSSNAALAYGDFLSQEQLNEGQIWAQMYEQSVQNYLTVLLSGKQATQPKGSAFQNINSMLQTLSGFMPGGAGSSGGSGGSASTPTSPTDGV